MSSRNPFVAKFTSVVMKDGQIIHVKDKDVKLFSLIARDITNPPTDADLGEIDIIAGQLSIYENRGSGPQWYSLTGSGSHTHLATAITEDANHRFVTDAEKVTWNNKVDSSYVDTRINDVIDTAPAALDTLNELAAALGAAKGDGYGPNALHALVRVASHRHPALYPAGRFLHLDGTPGDAKPGQPLLQFRAQSGC